MTDMSVFFGLLLLATGVVNTSGKPNFVILFADDVSLTITASLLHGNGRRCSTFVKDVRVIFSITYE